MEISLKTWRKLLGILLFITFTLLVYNDFFINNKEKGYSIALEYSNQLSFNGIVTKKTRVKKNHNNPLLVLNNGEKVVLFEQFYEKIEINDSIFKKENDLKIYIFRNQNKITLNLNDELKLMR